MNYDAHRSSRRVLTAEEKKYIREQLLAKRKAEAIARDLRCDSLYVLRYVQELKEMAAQKRAQGQTVLWRPENGVMVPMAVQPPGLGLRVAPPAPVPALVVRKVEMPAEASLPPAPLAPVEPPRSMAQPLPERKLGETSTRPYVVRDFSHEQKVRICQLLKDKKTPGEIANELHVNRNRVDKFLETLKSAMTKKSLEAASA